MNSSVSIKNSTNNQLRAKHIEINIFWSVSLKKGALVALFYGKLLRG